MEDYWKEIDKKGVVIAVHYLEEDEFYKLVSEKKDSEFEKIDKEEFLAIKGENEGYLMDEALYGLTLLERKMFVMNWTTKWKGRPKVEELQAYLEWLNKEE